MKRIAVIGFRGAGKSTTAKALARRLGWQYISTDAEIEKREAAAIGDIVKNNGWEYFRKLEAEMVRGFFNSSEVVLDTGGGVVENAEIMQGLTAGSMVIWIDAELEDIEHRLRHEGNRPLLNQSTLDEDIRINYQRRTRLYRQYAQLRFNTSIESVEEICDKIISEMRQT